MPVTRKAVQAFIALVIIHILTRPGVEGEIDSRGADNPTDHVKGHPKSDPLLQIRNRHSVACGDPPIINGDDPNMYIGYFQNAFGEQWVFSFDRATGKAELRGGDIGWNTVHEVHDGRVGELVLGREELAWLQACWIAATGS